MSMFSSIGLNLMCPVLRCGEVVDGYGFEMFKLTLCACFDLMALFYFVII